MNRRWTVVALVGAALLVGATAGPTVVQAATASLVRLEGGGSTHIAKVSRKGQLSVSDGTAHTKAGQLETTVAGAGQAVTVLGHATCTAGGFYSPPAGKALIITGITFYQHPGTATSQDEQDVYVGANANPCANFIAAGISNGGDTSLPQTFTPGIAVPAGDAIGSFAVNNNGSLMIYGYLVPASAVPAAAAPSAPARHRAGSATVHR